MNILEDLQWRGLYTDCTALEELTKRLEEGPITLYAGFDPTADSLHVGNLVPLIALRRFQNYGHNPIILAGGATGSIGDPSGKKAERQLLTKELLAHNVACVKQQLVKILDFSEELPNTARLVDNADWFGPIGFIEFLRETGKYFTVNSMIAKESVKSRLGGDNEAGISYTEFSYMLIQGYDFFHLNDAYNCELQIGGSDQWGNITVGTELTRKKAGKSVYGLTFPLITNADGSKFGKSVGGAIYLDPARTSVYRFYQFFINVDDRDVIKFLKYFTFLSHEEIDALEAAHNENPGAREAHRALAFEMTKLVHGEEATSDAINASKILFGGGLEGISENALAQVASEVPSATISKAELESEDGISILDALVTAGLSQSRKTAKKDLQGGGVNVNNERVQDLGYQLTSADVHYGKYILLRRGKKNYAALIVE
ncbi:tyrosine--tRNA ligase [Pelagicoccus sp. NFK12]|uniref:Tyrosine--tRNA ligase n=1 Tax=Pelagicoccus enzymogenes TaxID=2773457 RepID=A0A927IHD5_9BACT|nr:tyrosine--tRNA ligase [Pelagicoccus enzymogenes]MBD5782172.1 tyrosine--tRNA ligase [Pelagicoccus enzymogenes]MDQ8196925.1 tyrosine--tRNA ligase [Pelagicoccus enzymogenes]